MSSRLYTFIIEFSFGLGKLNLFPFSIIFVMHSDVTCLSCLHGCRFVGWCDYPHVSYHDRTQAVNLRNYIKASILNFNGGKAHDPHFGSHLVVLGIIEDVGCSKLLVQDSIVTSNYNYKDLAILNEEEYEVDENCY